MTRFAVIACPCGQARVIETRHETATCHACGKSLSIRNRAKLWQGDSAAEAAEAAGRIRADLIAGPAPAVAERPPRHDSPAQAAAAKARATINKSSRAELVALWMTRLVGQTNHSDLVDALQQAGLDKVRAEREIVRMLAADVLVEPRAGQYRTLET